MTTPRIVLKRIVSERIQKKDYMSRTPNTVLSSGARAYDKILESLRSGAYQPGDRLREEEVCQALGISRTPVREALRKLESDGIIEHQPRIGAIIRGLSHTEVVELYEMRLILERAAAEMAAKHGTEAEFDTLEAMNDRIETERDNPTLGASINQEFHQCLYLAARNRFLLETARALNNSLLLLGPTTYSNPSRIDVVVKQHREIIDALRAGDAEAAGATIDAHLQTSLRYRLTNMAR